MRTYTSKSIHQSHTPATRSKATRQAPVDTILQQYKNSIQRYAVEDEEPVQSKLESARQPQQPVQREEKPNNTGLPDQLKAGIENLSGYSMDDVTVHYNSDKPAQLQALAYAQGTDIHIAPGQEQHLPHEAWHVVQQKQGRVQPTMQLQGLQVNDQERLEKEADVMGRKLNSSSPLLVQLIRLPVHRQAKIIQRETDLQVQQGPSCWLFVLEALAKSKGLNTKFIEIIMNSYVSSREATIRKQQAAAENPPRVISDRTAALEETARKIDFFRQRLITYASGEGGRRNKGNIKMELVGRYVKQIFGSDNLMRSFHFSKKGFISVHTLITEIAEAKNRADTLIQIVNNEDDDVASLLNTSFTEITDSQDINDIHLSLESQDTPSYISVRHRYNLTYMDLQNAQNAQDAIIDLRNRKIAEMHPTSHAFLLTNYDKITKTVEYKDPNYGNYKIWVRIGQFRAMATGGRIKLSPFFTSGLFNSKLSDLVT
ncbi:MAG: DUF4157 domain-containing protein, partial [Tannerellaceae bacterium]|nr:DUF4157 domain-containing protein [Tannerellaceae bacterium]